MKKNTFIAVLALVAFAACYAGTAVRAAADDQWQKDQSDMVTRLDSHIADVQKRYDCVKAATSYDSMTACDRDHMPERGCP